MHKILRLAAALSASAALLAVPIALAQEAAKPRQLLRRPAKADAPKGKDLYPQGFYDFMLKQRLAQGQPDSPELRAAVRDELNTRELLVREAKKQGLDKNPAVKTEDGPRRADRAGARLHGRVPEGASGFRRGAAQGIRSRSRRRWATRNTRSATSWSRTKTTRRTSSPRCKRARSSRSSPSARRTPAPRSTAAISTGTRRRTSSSRSATRWWRCPRASSRPTPVQTQFGWHVIEVDDIRDAKMPPFDEVKPQLAQRMQGQVVDAYLKDLRAKNGL